MKFLMPLMAWAMAITASVAHAGDAAPTNQNGLASGSATSSSVSAATDRDGRITGNDVLGKACVSAVGAPVKLAKVSGPVVISRNGGAFEPAAVGAVVGPNDRVQVLKGGAGELQRGNCTASLPRDGVVQLADASKPVQLAQGVGGGGGGLTGLETAGLALGGAAIIGGITFAIVEAQKDSSP